jgi:hypothetical protein
MNHDFIERLEELWEDIRNALANGNNALADQLDMELNYIIEEEIKEHDEAE